MRKSLEFLDQDPELKAELLKLVNNQPQSQYEAKAVVGDFPDELEAIVKTSGRPALLVQDGSFEIPNTKTWQRRLLPYRSRIEAAIRSVARVDILNHANYSWLGTAWIIGEGVAVTNRHVALEFARREQNEFVFRQSNLARGGPYRPQLSMRQEYMRPTQVDIGIDGIRFIADEGPGFPDIALLNLSSESAAFTPIALREDFDYDDVHRYIAAIGYPAYDYRNPVHALARVFGDIYDVKRLSPGQVTKFDEVHFVHDCSTLGGSSGSVLIDVQSGEAIGLHFGGRFGVGNHGVMPAAIKKALEGISITRPDLSETPPAFHVDEKRTPADYDDRAGYQINFLGPDLPFPEPATEELRNLQAPLEVPAKPGRHPHGLDYHHFTVVMHKERRFALYTACNIDGKEWRNLPRAANETWTYDPRMKRDFQAGRKLYLNNDLDRGHLTRRQDPGWGDLDQARRADKDTFHFTNCAPQHRDFNQKTWLSLEDYVLANADQNDLRISVFTGPVFNDEEDPDFNGFKLPSEYWKVVALVHQGELRAAAYLLTQNDLIHNLEFVYGKFRTYNLPIAEIERITHLRFPTLAPRDLFTTESPAPYRLINTPADLLF